VDLLDRPCWLFDLDGTLTVAAHDFDGIRRSLGLRPAEPILEQLAAMSPSDAAPLRLRLAEIEGELADRARPQPGAERLLDRLGALGRRLGILTRNRGDFAWRTLRAAGLDGYFGDGSVLGRTDAAPKPSPEGVLMLLQRLGASPDEAVFVGDYVFDLEAGRRAGTATVHLDVTRTFRWSEHADREIGHFDELVL